MGTQEILSQAQEVRRAHDDKASEIVANRELTAEARDRRLQSLEEKTTSQLFELRDRFDVELSERPRQLRRELAGPRVPASAVLQDRLAIQTAYQAHLDRAEGSTSEDELIGLLERASRSDDELLARATMDVALQRSCPKVVSRFRELFPTRAAALDEFMAVHEAAKSRELKMLRSMTFQLPPRARR